LEEMLGGGMGLGSSLKSYSRTWHS